MKQKITPNNLFIARLAILLAILLSACESGRHKAVFGRAGHAIDDIFVSEHLCANIHECRKNNYVLGSPTNDGFYLTIFNVNDAEILAKVAALVTEEYYKNDQQIDIDLYVYAKDHASFTVLDSYHITTSPYITMSWKKRSVK